MLNGIVAPIKAGVQGFDCNTKLTVQSAKKLREAGFRFAIRYLTRKDDAPSSDLTQDEAKLILNAGLALMAVQHVESTSAWTPTLDKGKTYGKNAAKHAQSVGLPEGVNLWLDLEGVNHAVSAETIIDYCNAWFDAVGDAGYVAGIYVGANSGLSGEQLYWRLMTRYYWKSGSSVPPIPERGYCMVQTIISGDEVGGVSIDRNVTKTDAFGNSPIALAPENLRDEGADLVPEELPEHLRNSLNLPSVPLDRSDDVKTQLSFPVPGLYGYRSDDRRYGTALSIAALTEMGRIWKLRHPDHPIGIGEISKLGGGVISGHASHRKGVDIDMRPMRTDGAQTGVTYKQDAYSMRFTQELIDLAYGNGFAVVQIIFFNDSALVGRSPWPNHDDHLHIRFFQPSVASGFPVLRKGDKGAAVRELQRRLNFLASSMPSKFPPLAIDSDFGARTFDRVFEAQQQLSIAADGVGNQDTWSKLPVS